MKSKKPENLTALAIKSEMTPTERPTVARTAVFRRLEGVRLREYQDGNMTSIEMVEWFLQDVERATRADIAGATGLSWATVHGALEAIEAANHLRRYANTDPEEYSWKH